MTTAPLSHVRLVVFDLDGTLVDSAQDLATAVNRTLAVLAPGTPALADDRVRSFIGEGARVLIERCVEAAGLAIPVPEVLPPFLDAYRGCLLEHTRLYPGVGSVLDRLAGRTLAVLTNKPGEMSRAILHGLDVDRLFARVWGPDDAPARKPDPAGLQALMADLGHTAARTVMVGDSAVDMETARAAGVGAVGVTWGFDPEGLRRSSPDHVLTTLDQLPALLGL